MTDDQILMEYARERKLNENAGDGGLRAAYPPFSPSQFVGSVRTENELLRRLGRKWREGLAVVGSFFDEYKRVTSNYLANASKPVTVMPIPCTGATMLGIYGNKQSAANAIRKLISVGGIQMVADFVPPSPGRKGTARVYAYNKAVEKLALAAVEKHGVSLFFRSCPVEEERTVDMLEQYEKVDVCSKLRIKDITDDEVRAVLWTRYGRIIKPRLAKIEEMNKSLPKEQRIRLKWKIRRSQTGLITKIGIRATSAVCSLRSHGECGQGITFREYLNSHFKTDGADWDSFEHDVRGSIYKVTRLLSKGVWDGDDVDPYAEMHGGPFRTKADREAYKSLCMALYFDSSPLSILNHGKLRTPESIAKFSKKELARILGDCVGRMEDYTGERIDSRVFLHESLIYVDLVYKLRKMGIEVVQKYDGFYYLEDYDCLSDLKAIGESYFHEVSGGQGGCPGALGKTFGGDNPILLGKAFGQARNAPGPLRVPGGKRTPQGTEAVLERSGNGFWTHG